MKLNIIAASNINNILGVNNDLYIKSKKDLQYFKIITTDEYNSYKNVVIMGYNTWKSLKGTLVNRINIVVSKNHLDEFENISNVSVFSSLEDVFTFLNQSNYGKIFIIGGVSLYKYVFDNYFDSIDRIYHTRFLNEIDRKLIKEGKDNLSVYDFKLPYYSTHKKIFTSYDHERVSDECLIWDLNTNTYKNVLINFIISIYVRDNGNTIVNHEELKYLELMNTIINSNNLVNGRNGEVYSSFGEKMVFDVSNSFPLLTTKKMPWKTILRELLWFISGSTNNEVLQNNGVHIWDQNASKEFLESRGLNYEEGDLGPVYGFQWRHFGAEYVTRNTDYNGKGNDQLQYIIDEIKKNPHSRRLILNSWNASDIDKMALPPCHVMVQFYINDGFIDAQLYQRSGDMFLGVPFNIASYSFLLYIIGHLTGYKPRKLIHILGDAHVYKEHISAVKKQFIRIPRKFPKLYISNELNDINHIKEEYFKILEYESCLTIKAKMIA
tara:strand:+ start:694 stop:2175 length:1482 start_codon:yes stop_codon:yes gene_type:complete